MITINEDFYLEHSELILYLLKKKNSSLNIGTLQDLQQEVFSKAVQYQKMYNEERGSIRTWLGLLVTHVYDRYLRGSDVLDLISQDIDYTDDNSEAMRVSQEEVLHDGITHWYLANKDEADYYLNMLPKLQKEKLYLFLVMGHSHVEIAKQLLITEASSRTLISIAVKNLKKLVQADEPEKQKLQPFIFPRYSQKMYSGDWAWRPNEGPDRIAGPVYQYNEEEIQKFCRERNLQSSKRN